MKQKLTDDQIAKISVCFIVTVVYMIAITSWLIDTPFELWQNIAPMLLFLLTYFIIIKLILNTNERRKNINGHRRQIIRLSKTTNTRRTKI